MTLTFVVSQADPLRLDVTLPGEQHFYLRASTSHERQQWLVALGSAKACDRITKDSCEPSTSAGVKISLKTTINFFFFLNFSYPYRRET